MDELYPEELIAKEFLEMVGLHVTLMRGLRVLLITCRIMQLGIVGGKDGI